MLTSGSARQNQNRSALYSSQSLRIDISGPPTISKTTPFQSANRSPLLQTTQDHATRQRPNALRRLPVYGTRGQQPPRTTTTTDRNTAARAAHAPTRRGADPAAAPRRRRQRRRARPHTRPLRSREAAVRATPRAAAATTPIGLASTAMASAGRFDRDPFAAPRRRQRRRARPHTRPLRRREKAVRAMSRATAATTPIGTASTTMDSTGRFQHPPSDRSESCWCAIHSPSISESNGTDMPSADCLQQPRSERSERLWCFFIRRRRRRRLPKAAFDLKRSAASATSNIVPGPLEKERKKNVVGVFSPATTPAAPGGSHSTWVSDDIIEHFQHYASDHRELHSCFPDDDDHLLL